MNDANLRDLQVVDSHFSVSYQGDHPLEHLVLEVLQCLKKPQGPQVQKQKLPEVLQICHLMFHQRIKQQKK
ncbi:hypothetical protein PVIIG_05557 [Plasmodium vivax India VII]|uniref:Uncharacterized protein n=1 Tax=Plasmodium vivax India VII TaxID=1077284 RepID=A0A0J9SIH2_PLAVI|nr:hypothetical protein PVIIG_05557 [Plasmodium vivax India VII]